jgi:hypothetical protein
MPDVSRAQLDSLASLVNEKVTTAKDPSKPYVGLEHLPAGGSSLLGTAESRESISTNNVFRQGDVLFGKLRPRLRKSIRVPFDGYSSTDILILRPAADVDPSFAGFVLQSDAVFAEAIRTEEGTKMPRCSWSTLRKLRVFCPEPCQQERIVKILCTVDEAIDETLLVGQTSFTEERSRDFSLARRAVVGAEELRRYALAEGNILLSRVFATLDGVGQPTLVPSLPEPAVYESNMMRLRVDPTRIEPRLLFEWLRSHRARRLIVAGANASNQSSINQQVLNPLPILVPPSLEQERLLSIIESDDERASWERDGLHKLRGVKTALMQDLLSGRAAVTVTAAAEPQEVAANV